ncbi:protein kinase [Streptomyces sp. NPDC014734]|uniref:protein kinase domain-containing protein n=1 Tax=Streptomyces sp. NPDC014734 TaxID=3364886 RepID=UPI0036FE6BA3
MTVSGTVLGYLGRVGDDARQRAIGDRYLLHERLGSGGMGTVWRATDRLLGRSVAVKEVHLQEGGEEFAKRSRRAHREARAIAGVSHPNVVDVYDLVSHEDRLWLVMELVKGRSLAEHVAALGPMPPSRIAGIGLQLLDALDAVHAIGALHRDVKPANVLMREDGGVVLCDFGIVALADTASLTTPGAVIGTLEFIAPERLSGRPSGPPSDLFSLGATLCALVSGRSPFARPEPAAVLYAVMSEQPEVPAGAGPLTPVLEALLRKNPAERPTAAETAALLRPVAAGAGLAATPDAPPPGGPPAPSWAASTADAGAPRRRPSRRAVLSAGLALTGGVGAGLVLSRLSRDDRAAADTGRAGEPAPTTKGPAARGPASSAPPAHGSVHVDAAMPAPDGSSRLWLFYGDQYVRVDVSDPDKPFRREIGPYRIANWSRAFSDLPEFTGGIDAVLPVPGRRSEYWVFSGQQYIRIGVADGAYNDSRLAEPAPLDDWAATFGRGPGNPLTVVDALMPAPEKGSPEFWVFSGNEYVRCGLDGIGPRGRPVNSWQPLSTWSNTFARYPGFRDRIDAAVRVPGEHNNYLVFSGDSYVRMSVADGTYHDKPIQEPRQVTGWD